MSKLHKDYYKPLSDNEMKQASSGPIGFLSKLMISLEMLLGFASGIGNKELFDEVYKKRKKVQTKINRTIRKN